MVVVDVSKRKIGVNINPNGSVDISVWAPLARAIDLHLSNSNERVPLRKGEPGYWELTTSSLRENDEYKFIIDGKDAFPDPASLSQQQGVHGASTVINLHNPRWDDEDWNNLPLDEYILYEVHAGTFTTKGTFEGIEEKLPYLKQLGITAIEIMPVAQFPGDRNWGYDGVFPFAVQHSYGGPAALMNLVAACHRYGIAVVLDVVYNHMGPEGNYLGAFGPYFTEKYKTPWGGAINFDDAWSDGVRQYFIENALMWFRDFHIDALRLDAVHAIRDFSPVHILEDIKVHVDQLMRNTGRKHYLIVELDLNDTRFIKPRAEGGYGMDAQWIDEFHHALRVTAGGERTGYYADFNGITDLAKAYKDAYVYDGQFSEHRKKKFGIPVKNRPGEQFIVFSQNHDQVGNRMLGERTSKLVSFNMQKLLAAAVILSPYLPMLFMGEEWSEPNPFLYFVSHTDPVLAEAVRKGRKEEFAAFHAEGEAPDPMDKTTFLDSRLSWHLVDCEPHKSMLEYYRALISLRKSHPALKNTCRNNLSVHCDPRQKVLQLHRWEGKAHLIILLNFSDEVQSVEPICKKPWVRMFDSSTPQALPTINEVTPEAPIQLQPESVLIITSEDV